MVKNLRKFNRHLIMWMISFASSFFFVDIRWEKPYISIASLGLPFRCSNSMLCLQQIIYEYVIFLTRFSTFTHLPRRFSPSCIVCGKPSVFFLFNNVSKRIKMMICLVNKPINAIKWRNFFQFLILFPVATKIFQAGQLNFFDKKTVVLFHVSSFSMKVCLPFIVVTLTSSRGFLQNHKIKPVLRSCVRKNDGVFVQLRVMVMCIRLRKPLNTDRRSLLYISIYIISNDIEFLKPVLNRESFWLHWTKMLKNN